jgi:hypothetical protein
MTVTLLDIAAMEVPDFIEVRGEKLFIPGVPFEIIARVLQDMPEIGKALASGNSASIDLGKMVQTAPQLVKVIIAAGTGNYGNAEYEKAANTFSASDQIKILRKIYEVTFPGGIGPFVNSLADVAAQVAGASNQAAEAKAPAIN